MAEFVLEEPNMKPQQSTNQQHRSNSPRGNSISELLADRNGVPPTEKELQDFQNRLMGRSKDFSKLSQAEKERIMFEEMQNWHFSQMPSIDAMKKEIAEHPLTFEVKSLNESDTKGYNNQHINILSENVKLTVVSDGKTIKFNNKELLNEYREAVNKQNNKSKEISEVQKRGVQAHSSRVFED